MRLWVGTSGYSYRAWKGRFYPEKLPAAKMLADYATKLPAVEINNTFYRLPRASVLETWREEVPPSFRFAVKASRRITHLKRLAGVEEPLGYLLTNLAVLGDRLGVVLFQLPPFMKKDLERLEAFLAHVPPDVRTAFEFRHPSWMDGEVRTVLRTAGAALAIGDNAGDAEPEMHATADFGYLRLRREAYDDADMTRWVRRVRKQQWKEAFVFFKHEEDAIGPEMASRFLAIASVGGTE